MNDLISRQAAIDICTSAIDLWNGQLGEGALVAVRDKIAELPSAQSKKGKWVLVCDNNGMHFICNKCGAWRYHQEQNFCGECGADMRGEQDEP